MEWTQTEIETKNTFKYNGISEQKRRNELSKVLTRTNNSNIDVHRGSVLLQMQYRLLVHK